MLPIFVSDIAETEWSRAPHVRNQVQKYQICSQNSLPKESGKVSSKHPGPFCMPCMRERFEVSEGPRDAPATPNAFVSVAALL